MANKRIQPTVNPLRRFVHFAALNCCTNHRAGLPAADAGRYSLVELVLFIGGSSKNWSVNWVH